MSRKFRAFIALSIVMLVVSIGFNISQAIANSTAEPGSDQDPLISRSYVDQAVGQLTQKLQELQGQLEQMKKDNEALVQTLNTQDAAIKALQEDLKAVKNQAAGTPASSTSTATPSNDGAAATLKGTVTASALNVRAQASTSSAIVAKAYKGEVVTVVTKGAVWSSIKTAKGVAGFVQTQYLSIK